MKHKVLETIRKYELIQSGDKLVLGVSGGPDSLFMLNILNQIKQEKDIDFDFVVAHINHMIRKEASEEAEYVKEYCQKLGIQYYEKRIDVQKYANTKKIGTEEAGRIIRYEFFEKVLEKVNGNKIAIAHNQNDKIETIVMNLLRGCGTSGLKGIEPKRKNIIRPILEINRKQVEAYCEKERLNPRIDPTNFENIYTRNKIRNIVIPYIEKEFNPNIVETITRLSQLVKEEELFIEHFVERIYQELKIEEKKDGICLDLKKFNEQESVIQSRLILYGITKLKQSTKGIEKVHIDDIIKLCQKNIGNKYLTPNKNLKILVKNKKIFLISQSNGSVE